MTKQPLLLLVIIALLFSFHSSEKVDALNNYQKITAHRGSSGHAPENSVSSVLRAVKDGAGYAEIDVQLSADGVIVLFHDKQMSRIGIARNVTDMTYSEMMTADLGGWYSPDFAGERVPTLEAIIDAARDQIKLNIELKMYDPDSPLPEAVVSLIEREKFEDQCVIMSFDLMAITRVKALNPNIRTGLIISKKSVINSKIWASDIDVLSVKSKIVNRKFMKQAARHNKEVHAWTVNSRSEMRRLLRFNVASIITDYPDQLYKIVKSR